MPISPKQSNTEAEYKNLVERFSYLADQELKKCEASIAKGDLHSAAIQMPSVISLVSTIGYFRGQDGVFLDFRPNVTNIQGDLYANEDAFEARLRKVMNTIKASSEAAFYKNQLETAFVKNRT